MSYPQGAQPALLRRGERCVVYSVMLGRIDDAMIASPIASGGNGNWGPGLLVSGADGQQSAGEGVAHRGDVLRRRAAACADDVEPELAHLDGIDRHLLRRAVELEAVADELG